MALLLETQGDPDVELMRLVQAGDPEAFARLYDRHAVRLFAVARSVLRDAGRAEDAVQEGFLSIWRQRASYRRELGSFAAWSAQIVRHRAIDVLRSDQARPPRVAGDAHPEVIEPSSGSLQDRVAEREQTAALHASLRTLPAAQAEVISLAFFGGLTHTEISARLSLPEGTVKGRMRLGLEKLRRRMEAVG